MQKFTEREKEFFKKRDNLISDLNKCNKKFNEKFLYENDFKLSNHISLSEGDSEYNLNVFTKKQIRVAIYSVYTEREGGMHFHTCFSMDGNVPG